MNVISIEKVKENGEQLHNLLGYFKLTPHASIKMNILHGIDFNSRFVEAMDSAEVYNEEDVEQYREFYRDFIDLISAAIASMIVMKQAADNRYTKKWDLVYNKISNFRNIASEADGKDDILESVLQVCMKILDMA